MRLRIAPVVALLAVLSAPAVSLAQDQAPARNRTGFMMSARLLAPWLPISGGLEDLTFLGIVPVSLPRFVIGAQIGDLGVGAGLNFFSFEDTTFVLFGPTVSYAVAKSAGGRAQLHVLGSFTIATGSQEDVAGDDDRDYTVIGLNGGIMGRGQINEAFGLDLGVTFDFVSVSTDLRDDSDTNKGVQIVGFLGGTFVL